MKQVIEYLNQRNYRLVSLIANCERDFDNLCLHNITIAKAMGFSTAMVAQGLEKVIPVSFASPREVEALQKSRTFDQAVFQAELSQFNDWRATTDKPLGGGCFGPLTIVSDILGADTCLRLLVKDPGIVLSLLEWVSLHLEELARLEEGAGADYFWIAEPLASLLSPDRFWRFSGQFLKRIYGVLNIPGFLHVCGKTSQHTARMVQTGAQVLSIDYLTDLRQCINLVPKEVVIMGNLNPMLLWLGSPEEIRAQVSSILEDMVNHKNFMFSTGCSVPPGTPQENLELVIRLVRAYPVRSQTQYDLIQGMADRLVARDRQGVMELLAHNSLARVWFEEAQKEARMRNHYSGLRSAEQGEELILNVERNAMEVD